MALNPEDLSGGFQHYTVMAFINEKMAKHVKGPAFYLENISLSWAEVEDNLRDILEDSEMPSEAKDACAWSCLALGMRFAHRQSQAHACRMQRLHDFNKLHKSAAQTLASNLRELSVQQDMDRKEVAYNLRLTQAKLEEVERDRDMLRWKLFQAEVKSFSEQEWIKEGPGLATASATATGAGEEEDEAEAATTTAATTGDAAEEEEGQRLHRSWWRSPAASGWGGTYTSGRLKEVNRRSRRHVLLLRVHSLTSNPSYPAPCLIHVLTFYPPFTGACTPPRPAAAFTATSPYSEPFDGTPRSDVGTQAKGPQEPGRGRAGDPQLQRRLPAFRMPGDWDCPWCKAVNFSQREICFRCGGEIWLQKL
ncbi:LOW QUALITY PROTEIN: testis-expressed protein 13B [Hipposideros larvatus]